MFKEISSDKRMLGVTFLFLITAMFVVVWFTRLNTEKRIIIISGSFLVTSPIDTLTALPAFESFIKMVNPDLVIVDEFITPSFNLLRETCADSVPEWYESVSGEFRSRLERLSKEESFDIESSHPWRLDILKARRDFWISYTASSTLREKALFYDQVHKAFLKTFDTDTLFISPLHINTGIFDVLRKFESNVFSELFDKGLGPGSYTVYNTRMLEHVSAILSRSRATKILFICDANQKYWFAEELSKMTVKEVRQISQLEDKK